MDSKTKEDILNLIAQAQAVYENSILPENHQEKGYPYATGYFRATLDAIRVQVEREVAQ